MPSRTFRLVAAPALLCLTALVAAGCDGSSDAASGKDVADLRSELREAQRQSKLMGERLERMEKRMEGYAQDVDALRRDHMAGMRTRADVAPAAAPSEAAAAAPDDAPAAASPTTDAISRYLETESGQAAVSRALEAVQERQNADRRERMVDMLLDRFAQEADLTSTQRDDMRKILSRSFEQSAAIWQSMRDGGADMTPEERAAQRDANVAKMQEIRTATDDEVKAVLNSEQYGLYEQQSQRLRGAFGGDRGAGGAPGGFGGRGGR